MFVFFLDRHQQTKFNLFYLNENKIVEINLVNGFFLSDFFCSCISANVEDLVMCSASWKITFYIGWSLQFECREVLISTSIASNDVWITCKNMCTAVIFEFKPWETHNESHISYEWFSFVCLLEFCCLFVFLFDCVHLKFSYAKFTTHTNAQIY